MLSEEQLNALPLPLQESFQKLEREIISVIAERISKIGKLSATDIHRLNELQRIGYDLKAIKKEIAAITEKTEKEIYDIFYYASEIEYNEQKSNYDLSGAEWIPFEENERMQELVQNISKATNKTLINMSNTTGFMSNTNGHKLIKPEFQTLAKFYQSSVDYAILQAVTGQTDFHSAMKSTVRTMSDHGLTYIEYESGYKRRLDSSVRMNILGGLANLSHAQSEMIGKEIDADGYEISWHGGFRPTHDFGGLQFTLKQYYDEILPKMKEPNCYHRSFPILLGISTPTYSKRELEVLNAQEQEKHIFEGKEYNKYEAMQKQRRYETAIRREKDRAFAFEAEGDAESANTAKIKARQLSKSYKEFSKAVGLTPKTNRVGATGKIGNKPIPKTDNSKIEKVIKPKIKKDLFDATTIEQLSEYVKENWGVLKTDLAGLDVEAVKGTFIQMDRVISEWPELKGEIKEISLFSQNKAFMGASYSFANNRSTALYFNPEYYKNITKVKQSVDNGVKKLFHPQGSTWDETGVHELAHILEGIIIKQNRADTVKAVKDWQKNTTARQIVKKAWKSSEENYGDGVNLSVAMKQISMYAYKNYSETIAEAFLDVFSNEEKAQPLSREIVKELRRRLG